MIRINIKHLAIVAAFFLGGNATLYAQTDDEKEIKVTDKDGHEEVIDVPESMDTEFDNLLQDRKSVV